MSGRPPAVRDADDASPRPSNRPDRRRCSLVGFRIGKVTVAVVASLAMMLGVARPVGADDLNQQRAKIQRQRAQLRVQIDLAKSNDRAIEAEASRLARAVALQQAALVQAQAALAAADSRAADAQRRLADIDRQSAAARQALVGRAVLLYERPFESEAAAIVNAGSLNEYAQRQALVQVIEGRTADLLDQFRQQHLDETAASKDLLRARADADRRRGLLQAQEANLQAARAAADQAHAALRKRIADLQSESSVLARQEAALEAKLAASQASFGTDLPANFHGLIWPVHGPVTREFGNQPGGFHPGIDIAPPYGTPIHASGPGVVIYAGWESGYGNYTCIAHGGGISTCYAHQSAIYVHVGQSVGLAQVIGAEGSTGDSTGPHVHFEVRVNTVPNNPRRFIPGNP